MSHSLVEGRRVLARRLSYIIQCRFLGRTNEASSQILCSRSSRKLPRQRHQCKASHDAPHVCFAGTASTNDAGKQPQRATGSPEQPNGMENRSSNPPMWSTARVRASGPKQCCVDGELGGVRCIGRADEGHSCSKWIPPYCVYISPAMDSAMDSLNSLARRDGRAVWVRGRLGVRAGEQEVQDTGRVPGSEGKGEPVGGWRSVDRDPSRGRGLQILREKSVVILHLVG